MTTFNLKSTAVKRPHKRRRINTNMDSNDEVSSIYDISVDGFLKHCKKLTTKDQNDIKLELKNKNLSVNELFGILWKKKQKLASLQAKMNVKTETKKSKYRTRSRTKEKKMHKFQMELERMKVLFEEVSKENKELNETLKIKKAMLQKHIDKDIYYNGLNKIIEIKENNIAAMKKNIKTLQSKNYGTEALMARIHDLNQKCLDTDKQIQLNNDKIPLYKSKINDLKQKLKLKKVVY